MTEADLQQVVIDLARLHRYIVYHTYDSRRSVAGFPDLVLVGGGRVLFRELKTEKGRMSPAQQQWIDEINRNGGDADVWRPTDLRSGRIQDELT